MGTDLALRLTCVRRRPVAALGHELIELGLVLGEAKPGEELAKFTLLLLKAAQSVRTIFVERAIAARRAVVPGTAAHARAHPVHFALHTIDLVLPMTVLADVVSASHSSAPNSESEDAEP